MNDVIHWIFGPQLIGFIMLLAGLVQQKFPPTDINGMYGYRTNTSRKNQHTFDEGNIYSSRLLIKAGLISLIAGFITPVFINLEHEYITAVLTVACAIGIPLWVISLTEKHLKKVFDIQ